MGKIYTKATELIGRTPLLKISNYSKAEGIENATILAKLEYFNPAGSVKDRIALAMVEDAEKKGILKEGSVIIEPTSGNTGIGLASVGAAKGYRTILTLPETMSVERRNLLKAYGAELVLTEGAKGMKGAIAKAQELEKSIPGAVILGQFDNAANPAAHAATTGPEIWEDTDGKVDIFVATVGTSGTSGGIGRYLREKNPDVKIYGVEPAGCPVLNGGEPGPHKIQGIGGGAICPITDLKLYDQILLCTDEDAYKYARLCPSKEGLLIGISAGAALWAAVEIGKKPENAGKNIVVLFPDGGNKYLSSDLFEEV